MTKKTWGKIGLVVAGLATIALLGTEFSGADEKKVYISDDNLRAAVLESAKYDPETGEEVVIENELPTISQVEKMKDLYFYNVRSLEGIQHAKSVQRLNYSPANDGESVIDFRPLSGMDSL